MLGAIGVLAGAAGLAPVQGSPAISIPLIVALLAGVISVAGARHVLTSPKPVFAAIFFVLVIVAGCVLYLLLGAEFLAFALVIVYAGAILITYMFVLMLAHQAAGPTESGGASYDHSPRDPLAACVVGLALFLGLSAAMWGAADHYSAETSEQIADARSWIALQSLPKGFDEAIAAVDASAVPNDGASLHVSAGKAEVRVTKADGSTVDLTLPSTLMPTNTQSVGVALVSQFPVSLELAGVILLMSMLGAVVLARRQIESGDATRSAELAASGDASGRHEGTAP